MNFAEELNLAEQQIHTLNQAQALYPAQGELLTLILKDPKKCYEYEVTDTWLDLFLDSLVIHNSLLDDFVCSIYIDSEHLFDTNITKECFDKLKKILDEAKSI